MKKLTTSLQNFRYGTQYISTPIKVEWFHFDLNDDDSIDPRIFWDKEFNQFCDYTINNPTNFSGDKNYLNTSIEEIPAMDTYSLIPNKSISKPENIIIVPKPDIKYISDEVATTMFITLTNENGIVNHIYNLPFGVIGRIIF